MYSDNSGICIFHACFAVTLCPFFVFVSCCGSYCITSDIAILGIYESTFVLEMYYMYIHLCAFGNRLHLYVSVEGYIGSSLFCNLLHIGNIFQFYLQDDLDLLLMGVQVEIRLAPGDTACTKKKCLLYSCFSLLVQ